VLPSSKKGPRKEVTGADWSPSGSSPSEAESSLLDDVALSDADTSESVDSGLEPGLDWTIFPEVSSSWTRSAAASSSSSSNPSWAFVREISLKASARAVNFLDLENYFKKKY
jgi:hypothetical protein